MPRKYRIKALMKLKNDYLDSILEACNLRIRPESGKIYLIGSDPDDPPLFVREGQIERTLIFVSSEELFETYANNKETLKSFNPFMNINHLQYLCDLLVRELIHSEFEPDDRDIFDVEGDIHSDIDISNYIDIKRLPKDSDGFIEYLVVKFDPKNPGKFETLISAKGTNSLAALLMCFYKISIWINKGPRWLESIPDDATLDDSINTLLDKYENERRLNAADLKKDKKEMKELAQNNYNVDYSGNIDVIASMIERPVERDIDLDNIDEYDEYDGITFK